MCKFSPSSMAECMITSYIIELLLLTSSGQSVRHNLASSTKPIPINSTCIHCKNKLLKVSGKVGLRDAPIVATTCA